MTADAAFWDKLAEGYAKQPVENPEAFDRKIEFTKDRMTPDSVVLDIGCGTGSLALRLAPCAAHVHGLDLSGEMIRIAEDKAGAQNVDNVTFHVGPFDDNWQVLEDGSLDGICAYSILHLMEDRAAALSKIFDLLKPGGFFVSSTVCLGESRIPYRPLLWTLRKLGKAPYVQIIERQALEDEMRSAGFVALSSPDVGAKGTIGFMVATKPK